MIHTDMRYLPMGPYPIEIGIALTEEAFQDEMIRLGIKDQYAFIPPGAEAVTRGFCEGWVQIVCFDPRKAFLNKNDIAGVMVHEAVHIWQELNRRIKERNPGKEGEAYALQWIAQFLMEQCGVFE